MRTRALVQEPKVVPACTAAGDLERVPLHPGPCVERLVVGQLGPPCDELLRLLLHHRKLGSLVLRRVPREHHPTYAFVVLAVAEDRDAAATCVLELGEEVDFLGRLAELILVP